MEAREVIRQSKTNLQAILMSNINFVTQYVFEKKLLDFCEYADLKSTSAPFRAATELVDKMIFKGETTCNAFLSLLQDTKLTEVFPDLKIRKDLMDQLKSDLKSREDKREPYRKVENDYKAMLEGNKRQVEATEKLIRAEFENKHQFLREEEEARLAALREEGEQKEKAVIREMKNIEFYISTLLKNISAVEQELQTHNESFHSSYEHKQPVSLMLWPEPQLASGMMIDVAKHLGNLTFKVWEKMKGRVKFTPVILDPKTASDFMYLSYDLTSMRCMRPGCNGMSIWPLPPNPERFTQSGVFADRLRGYVLGSEGFISGKHSWEVEVGDHGEWGIGLANHSVYRKGNKFDSRSGIWFLGFDQGLYYARGGYNNSRKISVQRNPQRIRVELDYDVGEVSFYDPEDMTHIHTFKGGFTEKLGEPVLGERVHPVYPFFGVGPEAETKAIQICQVETCLSRKIEMSERERERKRLRERD